MRIATLFMLLFVGMSASSWGDDWPIRAVVGDNGGEAFAGPDESHYATSPLAPGQSVDVYRLDPGHWCAIRPPADSFCLVEEAAIELDADDPTVGRIIRPDERCWVGTMLGEVEEPMWQVKLRAGEAVRILGSIPASAGEFTGSGWYQIEPPRGEFRWVKLSELDAESQSRILAISQRPDSEIALVAGNQDPPFQRSAAVQRGSKIPANGAARGEVASDDMDIELAPAASTTSQWRPARRHPIIARTAQISELPPVASIPGSGRRELTDSASGASTLNNISIWPEALRDLDLRLSMEVLKGPAQWSLATIREDALRFKSSTTDVGEMAVADYLLSKIRRFEQVQHQAGAEFVGTAQAVGSSSDTPQAPRVIGFVGSGPVLSQRPEDANAVNEVMAQSTKFDAYGWLNELVRDSGLGQTTYVLQDDQGRVTHHIAPAPGLNLHRYLKSKIGVVGQKGFDQRLKLDHVTAERVVRIDTLTR